MEDDFEIDQTSPIMGLPSEFWRQGRYDTPNCINYYKDDQFHREDGPAREWIEDSSFEWWLNGKLHNVDGPAVGVKQHPGKFDRFYINGKYCSSIEEFHTLKINYYLNDL